MSLYSKPITAKDDLNLSQRQIEKYNEWLHACGTAIDYFAKTIPALGNITPEGLVDLIGPINTMMKDLKKVEGILKERLKSMTDVKNVRGDNYEMELRSSDRTALDQTAAKEYFEARGILNEFMTTSDVVAMYFKRL